MFTEKDLVECINRNFNFANVNTKDCVDFIFNEIKDVVTVGDTVKIKDFGNFKARFVEDRFQINLATKQKILVKAHNVLSFKPKFELESKKEGIVIENELDDEELLVEEGDLSSSNDINSFETPEYVEEEEEEIEERKPAKKAPAKKSKRGFAFDDDDDDDDDDFDDEEEEEEVSQEDSNIEGFRIGKPGTGNLNTYRDPDLEKYRFLYQNNDFSRDEMAGIIVIKTGSKKDEVYKILDNIIQFMKSKGKFVVEVIETENDFKFKLKKEA